MRRQIVFDLTSIEGILESLAGCLNLSTDTIQAYLIHKKMQFDLAEFLNDFHIDERQLLDCEILLVALHATTNNDECTSIQKYGLINLQQAITLETTLGNYLRDQGIFIDIDKKELLYQGKSYDLGYDSQGSYLKIVSDKLYKDYQINSFLSYDNVLNYGVEEVPEFLDNLSDLLQSNVIRDNWIKSKNKCYVIKFVTSLSNFAKDTFYTNDLAKLNEDDFIDRSPDELGNLKKIWVLNQSFSILHRYMMYKKIKDIYGILKFDVDIPYTNILRIYTPEEYLQEYKLG